MAWCGGARSDRVQLSLEDAVRERVRTLPFARPALAFLSVAGRGGPGASLEVVPCLSQVPFDPTQHRVDLGYLGRECIVLRDQVRCGRRHLAEGASVVVLHHLFMPASRA